MFNQSKLYGLFNVIFMFFVFFCDFYVKNAKINGFRFILDSFEQALKQLSM